MIAEWKRCIKLIKYGYNLKSSIVSGIFFVVIGIAFCLLSNNGMFAMGGLYIALGPTMMVQVIYTVMMAGLSVSSPRRRFIETWLQDGLQLLVGLLGYLVTVLLAVIKQYQLHPTPEESAVLGQILLYTGLFVGTYFIYMGMAYKFFLIGIFLFTGSFTFIYVKVDLFDVTGSLNLVGGMLGGLAFLLLGEVLSAVLRRLLYRKPLSKYALGAALRKQM